jgi:hypothetical protein
MRKRIAPQIGRLVVSKPAALAMSDVTAEIALPQAAV